MALALIVPRLTFARPFSASGLTRRDGWLNLSFGAKVLFADEYRLYFRRGDSVPSAGANEISDQGQRSIEYR